MTLSSSICRPNPLITGTDHPAIIPAWKSTWLRGGTIRSGGRAAIIKVVQPTNLGGCMFRGWDWLGNRIKSFPRDTPLFISAQDSIGTVVTDPRVFTNERKLPEEPQEFELKLNLWWSPGDTDCFIHNDPSLRCIPRSMAPAGCRNSPPATPEPFMRM